MLMEKQATLLCCLADYFHIIKNKHRRYFSDHFLYYAVVQNNLFSFYQDIGNMYLAESTDSFMSLLKKTHKPKQATNKPNQQKQESKTRARQLSKPEDKF